MDQILSPSPYYWSDAYFAIALVSALVTLPIVVFAIVVIVERANKCLDYASTIYILHLLMITFCDSFPFSLMWWLVNGGVLLMTVLISELICIRIEQHEISLDTEMHTI